MRGVGIECDIGELADLALSGNRDLEVSSMCATFAETEIISLLARGERREDIAASVHRAVAVRTLGLVAQVGRHTPVVMTGSHNLGKKASSENDDNLVIVTGAPPGKAYEIGAWEK